MTRRERLALVSVLGLAIASRVYRLTDRSLWIDETYSILDRGSQPAAEIIFASTLDSHPPLHYVALHYWMDLFGNSVLATRAHAVGIGVAGVLALYALGTELFGTRVGLLSALFLALSPMHLDASRTVRMYGLLVLLTAVSLYFFVRMIRTFSYRWVVCYAASTVLLLLTHPYAIFVVIAENAYILLAVWGSSFPRPSFSFPQWMSVQMVAGLWAVPGLVRMIELAASITTGTNDGMVGWIPDANRYLLIETFVGYAGNPIHYPYTVDSTLLEWGSFLALFVMILCIGIAFGEHSSRDPLREESTDPVSETVDGVHLSLLVLVSVILLPYLISNLLTPVFLPRSAIPGLVPVYLLVALGITRCSSDRIRNALVAVLVGWLLLSSSVYLTTASAEPWEDVAAHVDSHAEDGDLVVLDPVYLENSFEYYADQRTYDTVTYASGSEGGGAEQIRPQLENRDRVWIVSMAGRQEAASTTALSIATSSHDVQSHERYGDVHVYLLTRQEGTTDSLESLETRSERDRPVPRSAPPAS